MAFEMTQFLHGLGQARERQIAAATLAVDQFGEHVLGDAQQLCPVDTGALQASATTAPAVLTGESIEKKLSFNTDYAAAVHENLDAHHPVGQAKYLLTALESNATKLGPFIAERIKNAG